MIGSPELMDALRGIGLNLYERKLWVALLAKGTATAGELSGMTNVPRSRTYDVLQTLADKGFVIIQTSKPLRYVATPPVESLERVKKRLQEKFSEMEKKIERLKTSKLIDELNNIHKQGLQLILPEDITGALKGKYSVLQQIDSMLRNASSSVEIVTTPAGLNELFENHISTLKKLSENGIKIKIATRHEKQCAEAIKALSGIAEIRCLTKEEVPFSGRFYVVDGQQFMLGLSDPEAVNSTQDMMFWTKSKHAAKNMFEPLFYLLWEKAKPITQKNLS
ncbi:MAG: helix-turn-helix domain-containing protein [Candidatus Aenigmarchaeota archaeon]|nr:helix-turn-helix domain-containing protein [Candidatus Aenigmarchaeota archaeon]